MMTMMMIIPSSSRLVVVVVVVVVVAAVVVAVAVAVAVVVVVLGAAAAAAAVVVVVIVIIIIAFVHEAIEALAEKELGGIKTRQLKTARGPLMPTQQHLYNRLARSVNYSIFCEEMNSPAWTACWAIRP